MKQNFQNPQADQWFERLLKNPRNFPISFRYNQKSYQGAEGAFVFQKEEKGKKTYELCQKLDKNLQLRLIAAHSYNFGVSEWTIWFENIGNENSKIIEDPQSALIFEGAYPSLKGIMGDHVNFYRPYQMDLASSPAHFESNSGRATHINFPYFNLEHGNEGCMLAIGWAGTWTADFRYDGEKTIYSARSVNGMSTYLKPGEKIRTALFLRAPYTKRNENYATNFWRRWFIEENMPRYDQSGTPIPPFSTCCLASDTGFPNSDGSISERYDTWRPSLEKMIAEDAKVDFRWFDAGWYIAPDGESAQSYVKEHDWWPTVGTWELDPKKWPEKTFLESTDFARDHGMKTLVWFEPERVTYVDDLVKNYGYKKEWAIEQEGVRAISNNIGDSECFRWTVDRIKKMLTENKVELYREDNNCNAAQLWRFLDKREGESRKGITECKFIDAHYRMWDEFIECTLSYGGCGFVDSCASGGGRNDLESMRRGIPLLRSDYDRTTIAMRLSMTTAFNKWIPFCGANSLEKESQLALTGERTPYTWRGSYLPVLNVDSQFVQAPDQDFDMLRFGLREWDRVKPYLLKDFYLHTPWHTPTENTGFTAFSFYDSETKEGVLLAFRQEKCTEEALPLTLSYLKTAVLTDEDSGESTSYRNELILHFDAPKTAKLIWIKGE